LYIKKISFSKLLKVYFFLIIIVYITYCNISNYNLSMVISPYLVVIFSFVFFLRTRHKPHHLILSFFIFISNLSIVVSEYFYSGLVTTHTFAKNEETYSVLINILLLFIAVIAIFYKSNKSSYENIIQLKIKDNNIIFTIMVCLLLFIVITGINNRGSFDGYRVAITSYYSYGLIAILIGYANTGNSIIKKNILYFLASLYVIQDLIYGGRKTLFELAVLMIILKFGNKIKPLKVLLFGLVGYVLYTAVGVYRSHYDINMVSFDSVLQVLIGRKFVFDTPVGAYYASATHVYASSIMDFSFKIRSFIDFVLQIIFGGSSTGIGTLSAYISRNLTGNMGGGILPTHFFFWFGWLGVVLIASIITLLLNLSLNNEYKKYLSLVFTCSITNWYLYTPLVLFRMDIFAVTVIYFMTVFVSQVFSKNQISSVKPSVKY